MPTYQTKPRTVEAVRWTGQPILELPLWAQDPRYVALSGTVLYAYTKHGPVRVNRDDWLVLGNKEVHSFKDADFLENFEAVE